MQEFLANSLIFLAENTRYFLPEGAEKSMYKPVEKLQHSFLDFNQPLGLKMNPENRWIRLADCIPWDELEIKYAALFPSDTGKVAKPLRMALGSLIIQKKFQYSDRELVEQITENPYLQYFIGLPGYQEEPPFDPSTLVLFRKRLDVDAIMEANAIMFDKKDDDNHTPPGSPSASHSSGPDKTEGAASGNQGTLIVDATCAPANIRYPQDISLLNEAREKLEAIIYRFCKAYALPVPRRYARKAKIILPTQNAGDILQNRREKRLKGNFPTCDGIWDTWISSCQKDMLQQRRRFHYF